MTLEVILTGKDVKAGYDVNITTDASGYTSVGYTLFPDDTRIGTLTENVNLRRLYTLGSREIDKAIVQKFEGSIGIDMPLFAASFANSIITSTVYGDLAIDFPTYVRILNDFVPQRVEISVREDELVRLSVDGAFAKETVHDKSTEFYTSPVAPATAPVYPAHIGATISNTDGVTNVTIRSATVRVNLNNEMKWGIGSRTAQAVIPKQKEIELTIEAIISEDMLTKILSDTQNPVDIVIGVSYKAEDGTLTSMNITVSGAYLDSVSAPMEPNTEIYATLTYVAKDVSIA